MTSQLPLYDRMAGNKRYAHAEGLSYCALWKEPGYIITCGNDQDIRIFDSVDGDCVSEFSTSFAFVRYIALSSIGKELKLAVAGDDSAVHMYTKEGDYEGKVLRFSGLVNSIDIRDSLLVAGSADFSIKFFDLDQQTQKSVLVGHEGPVFSVKFSPKADCVCSTSGDGTLRLWSVDGGQCVHKITCLPKRNDLTIDQGLCRVSWCSSDTLLAVPCGPDGVKVLRASDLQVIATLLDASNPKECWSVSLWSPDEKCVIGGSCNGRIVIWNLEDKSIYHQYSVEDGTAVCSIIWKQSDLVVIDSDGCLSSYETELGQTGVVVPQDEVELGTPQSPSSISLNSYRDKVFLETSVREFSNDSTNFSSEVLQRRKRSFHAMGETDDNVAAFTHQAKKHSEHVEEVETVLQPFQPSESPRSLPNRIMVYNLVGMVFNHVDEVGDVSAIEVEFHDSTLYHSFTVSNVCQYEMASLSSEALCLASRLKDEQSSLLHCEHFGSWDSSTEWTIPMPKKEDIECVAQGSGWIAAATSCLNLRLFTTGGVQREVLSLPGPVLTMAGWENQLVVVFQIGVGDSTALHVWVLDVAHCRQVTEPRLLSLSPDSTLKWIGFSGNGKLGVFDSTGILRILTSLYGHQWIPVLDAKQSKKNFYFPVGLTDNPDELRCILCKGQDYPPLHPRPVMMAIPLKVPVCEPETEKGKIEEAYIRNKLMHPERAEEAENVKGLMKMFAIACKSSRLMSALEIAKMFPNEDSISVAIAYCSKSHLSVLQNKISSFLQEKSLAEDTEEEAMDDQAYSQYSVRSTLTTNSQEIDRHATTPKDNISSSYLETRSTLKEPKTFSLKTNPKSIIEDDSLILSSQSSISNPFKAPEVGVSEKQSTPLTSSVFENMASKAALMGRGKGREKMHRLKTQEEPKPLKANKDTTKVQKKLSIVATPEAESKLVTKQETNGSTNKVSAFSNWLVHQTPILKEENPSLSDEALVKAATKEWRKLSSEEKQKWK